jgi:hypothetical protein
MEADAVVTAPDCFVMKVDAAVTRHDCLAIEVDAAVKDPDFFMMEAGTSGADAAVTDYNWRVPLLAYLLDEVLPPDRAKARRITGALRCSAPSIASCTSEARRLWGCS